ncbi:NAD-P-binding protein [Neolentinus lepideus HHB14362 ss-1]|uniref:NAD-P-binding protein n=1 Tax=Neolentinus lepideus HHB14362 ss-1 TaxID=1314782 RepID=A0A165PAX4_9AGAM|nr:NAD-P-binding protein [Neolentinus lepideus HHB14362 ss-1]
MSKPIKTCVLGVGLGGLVFHVPFVLILPQYFTLHAVMERNPASPSRGKAHEKFDGKGSIDMRNVKIHRTLDAVTSDPEVELVVVTTPSETHYSLAKAALEAGKHVLVDKPVTATSQQAKELGALAKSKGVVLYGFQNRRWDSDFLALRRLLALPASSPQSLGDIHEFESHYDRYRAELKGTWKDEPKPANGQVYDLGAHLIDQALVLFGRPEKITAFISNMRGVGSPEVDDNFTIFFHYPPRSGSSHPLTVILRAAILSVRAPQLRYVVRGTRGTFIKYGLDVQEDQIKVMDSPEGILNQPGYGKEPESIWGTVQNFKGEEVISTTWPTEEAGSYVELWKNLGEAIRSGKEQAVKWEESTAVIEMIELAHQSSKEGRTIAVPKA